jgi:seryl-tRNA synthetase
MHDINFILNSIQLEKFIQLMSTRKIDEEIFNQLINLKISNDERKSLETKCQEIENQNNIINKEIPILKKNNKNNELLEKFEIVKNNNSEIKNYKEKIEFLEKQIKHILENCPNIPLMDSKNIEILLPIGEDEEKNKIIKNYGEIRKFNFKPLSHEFIGEKLGLMDFEQTAKISGSRFVTLKGKIARLEQALINFMIDIHIKEHGYELVSPPYLVKNKAMYGVGQLPKFSDQSFVSTSGPNYGETKILDEDNSYRLIPTAEVSLTNLFSDKIISQKDLPIRYVAATPCFRSEIGSGGRDVTGIIRLHQFMKIELVSFVDENEKQKIINFVLNDQGFLNKNFKEIDCEFERMTHCACTILEKLNLPYRVTLLSTGDTGFSSHITYDLEVWMPSQNKYREISSCSYFGDFQGRRMNGRYKDETTKKNKPIHTLNGSALAVGRTIAAIIENYQTKNGDFEIPEVLEKYF